MNRKKRAIEIEGMYSEDGHKLPDAFKGNNYLKGAALVTVK